MSSTLKDYKYSVGVFLFLLLGILLLDWSIWGQDGLSLWMPIIAEYLRGAYVNSIVIFGGQNLFSIYGELPFWKILNWLNVSPVLLLNFTFLFLIFAFYILTLKIFKGLSGKDDNATQVMVFIYCLLSPIILNRVYAGHFNLLFGILPILVCLSLIYHHQRLFDLFCSFVLVCSFSIQSYQILVYHLFYIPLLFLWVKFSLGTVPSWYIKKIVILTLTALLFSSPIILEIYKHSISSENLRSDFGSVVYSYIVSIPADFSSLIMSSVNSVTTRDNFFLFHELNYPLGLTFLSVFFLKDLNRKLLLLLIATMLVLFGFSSGWPGINLLSKIPLINLFRVPQRSLMIAAYLVPLFFLVSLKDYINFKAIFLLIALTFVGNGVPYFELLCFFFTLILCISNKWKQYPEVLLAVILSTLFLGLPEKYVAIRESNMIFNTNLDIMKKIDNEYMLSKNKIKIHVSSASPLELLVAANYLGIPTAEGYGHPPRRNFNKMSGILPIKVEPMTNILAQRLLSLELRKFLWWKMGASLG